MEELLTETQVSRIIKKSLQSLRNDRHLGRGIPYVKIGASVRYPREVLEEYIKKNLVVPEKRVKAQQV